MCQKARDAVRGLLGGDVSIVEDGGSVFVEVEMSGWYITDGAQELSRGLLSIRARRWLAWHSCPNHRFDEPIWLDRARAFAMHASRHAEARGPMLRSGDLSTPNHGRGGARLCRWRDGGQNTYPRRTVGERRNVGAYLTFALYHWPFT